MSLPAHIQAAIDRKAVYHDCNSHRQGNATKSKPCPVPALASDSGDEKQNPQRSLVRITCYRTRRQDPDNAIIKWHIDALRFARIIDDDTEDHIELKVSQVRVSTKKEERTEITVCPILRTKL